MQNKINLDTHNEVIPANEPWHRGSGFTWMLLALAGAVFFLSGAVAKAQTTNDWKDNAPDGNWTQGAANARWWSGSGDLWNVPNNGNILRFNNNHYTSMTNNASNFTINGIIFGSLATTGRTIGGNSIGVYDANNGNSNPFFQNDSGATHTINLGLTTDSDSGDPVEIRINGAGGMTFGGAITNNGVINVQGSSSTAHTVRFNGVVSGAGGMYVNQGNATVLLDAANTQSGQLTINAGTVRLNGTGDTFGGSSQAIRIGSGAILDLNNVSTTVGSVGEEGNSDSGSISLGSGTLTVSGSASTFQGNISGTGGITHSGSGSLALHSTQSYTGTTTVSAGMLSSSVAMASTSYDLSGGTFSTTAANVISDTASVTLRGGTLSIGGNEAFGNNGVSLSSSSIVSVGSGSTASVSGAVTGAGGLTKSGSGSLALTGANTYSGGTTISGGTLVGNTTSIQGNVANNATLEFNQSANGTYSGAVSGNGKLIKTGSADLTLSGNNTYTGNTEIDAGALKLSGSIASGSKVFVGNGGLSDNAELNLSGTTALGSAVQVNIGTGTRTISKNDGTSQTISGAFENNKASTISVTDASGNLTMSGVASGSGALTKSGSGTLTLSGSGANTRSGGTDVNAGTLVLAKDAGVNAVAGQVNIASGAMVRTDAANQLGGNLINSTGGTLNLNNNSQVLALAGSGAVQIGNATLTLSNTANDTFSGVISGTGAVEKKGTGTQYLTGANDYSGATTISTGSVEIQNATALGTTAAGTTVADNAQLKLYHGSAMTVAEALTLNGDGQDGSGALRNVGGDNIVSGNITLGSGARINSSIAGSLAISGNVSGGANVLYMGGSRASSISGEISGTGGTQDGTATSLYKDGGGILTLSGANSYTGDTRIVDGNLTVASGGSLGNGSDVFVSSNGVLTVNVNTTVASLREAGEGNSGTAAIGTGATLTINGANKGTNFFSTISGAGNLTFSGSGNSTASLFNNQTYTGTTTITDGKLISSGALSSAAYSISGGTFETVGDSKIGNSATIAISGGNFIVGGDDTVGAVTATGGRLSVAGGKTASLSANSTIGSGAEMVGGTIAINSGATLTLNSNDADNSSALTIASGGTLTGSGTTTGTLSVDGFLAPGNSPGTMNVGATTFLGGGTYQWEINDWTGTKGANPGYDWLNVTGALTFASTGLDAITNTNRFTIDVVSLLSSGTLTNFDPASTLSFVIATASGGISNFGTVSSFIDINSAGFLNNDYAGNWSLAVVNGSGSEQSLQLTFAGVSGGGGIGMSGATAIPEPSVASMFVLGLSALLANRRRRA